MISITISIFLLILACIGYKNDPVPVRRTAIKVLTIIDIPLTALYLYFFISAAINVFKSSQKGVGYDAGGVMLMMLLLLPIALALPAIFFGIKALLDRMLIAEGMAKAAEEENLKNTSFKFCVKCKTSVPHYETECKHCKGTEFTFEAPNEVSVIPQQIRNNTPSDDEIEK